MRTSIAVVFSCFMFTHFTVQACENWSAMVVSVNGQVEVYGVSEGESAAVSLRSDDYICPGQQLRVGANSRAAIYLSNNSFVRLEENSVLYFPNSPATESESFWIELKQGVSHFISRLSRRFEVKTPYVNAAVDGTEFLVAAGPGQDAVSVIEGQVSVTEFATGAELTLQGGQQVKLESGQGFQVVQISASETVDWAVYFPPLLVFEGISTANSPDALVSAQNSIKQQRPDLAISTLKAVSAPDPGIRTALAAAYMSVGKIESALAQINGLNTADGLALQSLAATLRNQSARAVELAQSAMAQDDQSLPALLALSYGYQADLDFASALKYARHAVERFPGEYAPWVRLSEMLVATGDIRGAEKAIERARDLNGSDVSVLTQSGFISLFNHRYSLAHSQFDAAILAGSENPQARLGLGLTQLRQGKLEAGRMQLEYAVSLDPARSILRSYLGRAYFEEKRDEEASVQWDLAKQLDPQDPTAYFYEGVRKLYANDPIGAIDALETSRTLNDERALYRSETLLQSDAASRSAALARAYDEVGYDQGVLLAGWDAIRRDPTNSEGHRLLADKYRGNSRYEAARASELLQSQLWQPLSAYPLQPQLSETGIGFVEGAGPQQPGYNEYHSLFTQDGVYGAVNGYGGSDGTWGDDLVGSFLAGPVAVSLGQYHFESDGWRDNTDQEQDVYSGFVQWEVSPSTSIQFEKRKLNWEHGNIYFNEVDAGLVEFNRDYLRETEHFGLRHRLSQDSFFLLSAVDQVVEEKTESIDIFGIETVTGQRVAPSSVEMQAIRLFDSGRVVVGAGYLEEDELVNINSSIFGFELLQAEDSINYEEVKMYVYVDKAFNQYFGLGLGASYANSDEKRDSTIVVFGIPENPSESVDVEKILPKVGGYVNLGAQWVLRGAYFETLQRNESAMQTIEPVSFMGFGQIVALPDDSYTRNSELSLDGVFDQKMFVGVSVYDRRILHQFTDTSSQTLNRVDLHAKERGGVTYWDQTLSDSWVLNAAYEYSVVDDEIPLGGSGILSGLETQMVPLGVRYIWSEYVQLVIRATYYFQESEVVMDDGILPRYIEAEHREEVVTDIHLKVDFGCACGYAGFGVSNIEGVDTEFSAWNSESFLFYPGRMIFWYVSFSL